MHSHEFSDGLVLPLLDTTQLEEVCICNKSLISSQVGVFAGVEKSQPSTLHFTGAGAMVVRFVFH